MDKPKRKKKVVKVAVAAKKKSTTTNKQSNLALARALHQSIAKRMMAAGFTHDQIKKDVEKARADVRSNNTRGN